GTTTGSIALDNLQAAFSGYDKAVRERPGDQGLRKPLADLLAARGQYLGRIADYERAAGLAEELVAKAPKDAEALLLRAQMRSTFHRFGEALGDLGLAEKLDVPRARI